MRDLLSRLARAPDAESWSVATDWLIRRDLRLPEEVLGVLEAELTLPPLRHSREDLDGELFRRTFRPCPWRPEEVLHLPGAHAPNGLGGPRLPGFEGASVPLLRELGVEGELEARGTEVFRFSRVVETVTDPLHERSLTDARGVSIRRRETRDVEWRPGDRIGEELRVETRLAATGLLHALDRARPTDASGWVDRVLAWEARRTRQAPEDLLRELDDRIHLCGPHEPLRRLALLPTDDGELRAALPVRAVAADPGPAECLASEVAVAPGTWVAFDRGALDEEEACRRIDEGLDRCSFRYGASLVDLLRPLRLPRAVALVRRIRAVRPVVPVSRVAGAARAFDDHRLLSRFDRLSVRDRAQVLLEVLEELTAKSSRQDPVRRLWEGLRRCAADEADPGKVFATRGSGNLLLFSGYEVGQRVLLALYVGDLLSQLQGREAVSRSWVREPLSAHCATRWIARHPEDQIDRWLGPEPPPADI